MKHIPYAPGHYVADGFVAPVEVLLACAEDSDTEDGMINSYIMLNSVMTANAIIVRLMGGEDNDDNAG